MAVLIVLDQNVTCANSYDFETAVLNQQGTWPLKCYDCKIDTMQ